MSENPPTGFTLDLTDSAGVCAHLQSVWDANFPAAKAMGLEVVSFEDHVLTARAPLALNTNIHNTGFAGSLYTIQAMTAWGSIYLATKSAGMDAFIILARSEIDYAATVEEDLLATSDLTPHLSFLDQLRESGKARLDLTTHVHTEKSGQASSFQGRYITRV